MLILVDGRLEVEHPGLLRCHVELTTWNGCRYMLRPPEISRREYILAGQLFAVMDSVLPQHYTST